MCKWEKLCSNMVDKYIEEMLEIPMSDSDIRNELEKVFTEEELTQLGYSNFGVES